MITKEFILENKDKWEEYRKEINELDKDILRELIVEDPDIINIINLDRLDKWDISWVLSYQPKLIKYLKLYLDKLGGWNISTILEERPELIKDLESYLDKLASYDIYWILGHHPGLIKDLKPYLDKLDGENIRDVLMDHPDLIKDLKLYLHKLDKRNIHYVLGYKPGLIKYFKPYLYKLDKLHEMEISGILEERPELSLLFKYLNTKYEDAAYYCTFPSEISKLDEEEKYELSKKMVELIRKEKK